MSDYFNPNFPIGGYQAVHKGRSDLYGHVTPNFEIKEGMRFGQFYPAAYLPISRYEPVFQDRIVMGAGKPVALDSNGALVPAGLRLALALGAGNGPQYSADDVAMGVTNAEGNAAVAGAYVVDSMIAAGLSVGACLGVASYDVYMLSGADPTNPGTYKFHNYNRQTGVAVLTDYLLEFPIEPFERIDIVQEEAIAADANSIDLGHATVVEHSIEVRINGERDVDFSFGDGAGAGGVDQITWVAADHLKAGDSVEIKYYYEDTGNYNAPFKGIASFRGSVKPGDYVTFDENSAWVAYSPAAIANTDTVDAGADIMAAIAQTLDIVGQVTLVDYNFPKQFLDRVKTAHDDRLQGPIKDGRTGEISKLDKMPGSATDGAPHNVHYAGGDVKSGIVQFNMNIR
jgi:hypothetical protein